jgi:vacuolar-type H+-ATPase subunit C/Vma6
VITRGVDMVAGNSRLRARWPALLGAEPLRGLRSAEDAAGVLLASGQAVHGSGSGLLAAVLDAVDVRRDALLRAAVHAYHGPARDLVGTLVSDLDLADIVTLLRGAATAAPPAPVRARIHRLGWFDPGPVLELLAREPAAVASGLAAQLPDPELARAVGRAWRDFELHADLAELEATTAGAHARGVAARLRRFGRVADPVRDHLSAVRDATNLVTALRLRSRGQVGPADLLPGGTLPAALLRAVAAGRDVVTAAPRGWRDDIRHAVGLGVEPVARALGERTTAGATHVSWRTEPLGARVPVAYVAAVRAEAAALRRAAVQRPSDRAGEAA